MTLSQEAVDELLMIISNFDRERGIPHDYLDLEHVLQKIEFEICPFKDIIYVKSPFNKIDHAENL